MQIAKAVVRIAMVMLVALTLNRPAAAAPILDQNSGALPTFFYAGFLADFGIDLAQTFTVGLAGQLTSVDVAIARTASDPVFPLIVEIRTTTAGIPDAALGSVLASGAFLPAAVPDFGGTTTSGPRDWSKFAFRSVDLSAANLMVTPGQVLAIALRSEAIPGGYAWAYAVPDPYAGGHGFFRGNNPGTGQFLLGGADQFFRTYVDSTVPEPASLLLLGAAVAGFAARRASIRRRKVSR